VHEGRSVAEFDGSQPEIEQEVRRPRVNDGRSTERTRASKDKNKARVGNHNRKAGHDRKMAKGLGS
jgi:hypothetical protein